MIRLVPPIAVPVKISTILSSVVRSEAEARSFLEQVAARSGFTAADPYSSGRAALAAYLSSIPRRDGNVPTVILPAYTCWSVPASVVHAGLRIHLIDVDPEALDLDHEALRKALTPAIGAVVAPHLFARSCDVDAVCNVVRTSGSGAVVVEDGAQAWPVNSTADAALLSFGRGKPLALGGGGALLHRGVPHSEPKIRSGGLVSAAMLLSTRTLAQARIYRLFEAIPFFGIGQTRYDPTFGIGDYLHGWQYRLGSRSLAMLAAWQRLRTGHSQALAERIRSCPGWRVCRPADATGMLRLPVMAPSRRARELARRALRRRGVASSPMYPGTLADIADLRRHVVNGDERFPGAEALRDRLLTLPVYPSLTDEDITRIADVIGDVLPEATS